MALYTEQSADWLNNVLATGDDNRRRTQLALYEARKEAADKKYDRGNGGLGGFLSNLFRDVNSVGNTLKTTAAAYTTKGVQDSTKNAINEATNNNRLEQDRIAREYGYSGIDEAYDKGDGPEEMWQKLQDSANQTRTNVDKISNDYKNNWAIKQINDTKQSQYGADALRTLNLGFNLMAPGAAATPLGGAVSGAIGGVADSLEATDGTLLDLQARTSGGKIGNTENTAIDGQDMLKRAAIGAGVGAATAGVGGKIGNAKSTVGSKLLNNKFITSGAGRGAVSGALGGALSGGTYAALEGGDVANAALQGGLSGGLTGAVAGGASSGAKKLTSSVANKLGLSKAQPAIQENVIETPEEIAKTTATKVTDDLDIPDYTKPTDYQGNELKIEKKNVLQKLGNNLSKAGEKIDNAELYNSLNSKTANDIVKNKTVEQLRKVGYKPEDYAEAAKISTTTNKFVDDIVKNSGATITDNGLVDRIANPSEGNVITNKQLAQEYTNQVRRTINTLEKNSIPGQYNAGDLLTESRRINNLANKYYKQSKNANGGDLANERGILADALMDVKKELRSLASKSVDGFGDNYTKSQLTQRLKNLGATDAAIKDMSEAKNIGEFISKTAKYEDARQMAFEMQTNEYKRSAVSGSKSNTNPVNRLMQDSGAGEIISVATRPAGKLVGKGAKLAGNVISGAGDLVSGKGIQLSGTPTPMRPTTAGMQTVYNLIGQNVGRTEGNAAMDNANRAKEFKSLEDQLSYNLSDNAIDAIPGLTSYNTLARQSAANTTNQAGQQLAYIAEGMNNALAAGDLDSYNKLASLYQTAYKIYSLQNPQASGDKEKLTEKQQKANAAASILDQLETMNPDYGYTVRDIPVLNLVNATGNQYASTADSLATQLGYMMSGATVTPAEYERIKMQYVPQPWDSEAQRKYKLQQAREVIRQYQNGYANS